MCNLYTLLVRDGGYWNVGCAPVVASFNPAENNWIKKTAYRRGDPHATHRFLLDVYAMYSFCQHTLSHE
jgi:hypothetical protein